MLVGNKVDLEESAAIDPERIVTADAHEMASQELGILEKRASAKTGKNVVEAFEQLIIGKA